MKAVVWPLSARRAPARSTAIVASARPASAAVAGAAVAVAEDLAEGVVGVHDTGTGIAETAMGVRTECRTSAAAQNTKQDGVQRDGSRQTQ